MTVASAAVAFFVFESHSIRRPDISPKGRFPAVAQFADQRVQLIVLGSAPMSAGHSAR